MYNVYGRQKKFVERITRVFILRMRSLGKIGPLRRDTVFVVARIVNLVQLFYTFQLGLTSRVVRIMLDNLSHVEGQ